MCALLYSPNQLVESGTSKDQDVRRFGHHKVSRERLNAAGENGQAPRRERCIAKGRSVDSSRPQHKTGWRSVQRDKFHPSEAVNEYKREETPGRLRGRDFARCRSWPDPMAQHNGCHDRIADGTVTDDVGARSGHTVFAAGLGGSQIDLYERTLPS